jgi:hypothetical protein
MSYNNAIAEKIEYVHWLNMNYGKIMAECTQNHTDYIYKILVKNGFYISYIDNQIEIKELIEDIQKSELKFTRILVDHLKHLIQIDIGSHLRKNDFMFSYKLLEEEVAETRQKLQNYTKLLSCFINENYSLKYKNNQLHSHLNQNNVSNK